MAAFTLTCFARGILLAQPGSAANELRREETCMLWTVVVVLLILWLLGFTMNVAGGIVHVLLVIALVIIVFRLLSGRKAI